LIKQESLLCIVSPDLRRSQRSESELLKDTICQLLYVVSGRKQAAGFKVFNGIRSFSELQQILQLIDSRLSDDSSLQL